MNYQTWVNFGTSAISWSPVSIKTTEDPQSFINQDITTSTYERGRLQLSTTEEKWMENFPLSVSVCAGMTDQTVWQKAAT